MNSVKHVAIIMDGNGRWGIKHKKSRNLGHKEGLKTVEKIIKTSIKNKIKYLTLYAFSTENWKRPKKEINFLFNLLENFLLNRISEFNKQNIRLKIIGKKTFSKKINILLNKSEKKTFKNKKLQINLALNYGSKSELVQSFNVISRNKKRINEKNISKHLFTQNIPDPDILIRTGNTQRLSNFLLWQLAYSEIFFEKKLWPDFNENDYNRILNRFKKIKRNYGNI
jgi:undecaprenyl diphosphate synthase|tara:strand:+ start:1654 stop:2328 length:675 start_codon:yes stop_codon:yes gene_type:complete